MHRATTSAAGMEIYFRNTRIYGGVRVLLESYSGLFEHTNKKQTAKKKIKQKHKKK